MGAAMVASIASFIFVLLLAGNGVIGFQAQKPKTLRRRQQTSKANRRLPPTITSVTHTYGHSSTQTSLDALSPLTTAASPIGSVVILAGIVVVHELGHYLAAKRIGVSVEEFSVGFGPKLFGFQRPNGDEFNLRALPLGGYVRFPENYNATDANAKRELEFKAQTEFMAAQNFSTAWKVANALTVGILEDQAWNQEKKRRTQAETLETKKAQSSWWRKLIGLPRIKTNAISDAKIKYYDDPNLLQNRPWTQRAQVISGGVIFNLIFAFLLCFGQVNLGAGIPVPKFGDGILVNEVVSNIEAPARGILERGDVILSVNGSPVDVASPIGRSGIDDFISMTRSTPDGGVIDLKILHDGKQQRVRIAPKQLNPGSPPTIGVMLSPNVVGREYLQAKNPVDAFSLAYKYLSTLTVETTKGYGMVFGGLFAGSGTAGLSGPVGLIKEGSKVVATKDWTTVILFASAISVNLAVLNSLPLPALDGGQMVFILSEALTGKKVDQEIEERITSVAVLFLIVLSLAIFAGDLSAL